MLSEACPAEVHLLLPENAERSEALEADFLNKRGEVFLNGEHWVNKTEGKNPFCYVKQNNFPLKVSELSRGGPGPPRPGAQRRLCNPRSYCRTPFEFATPAERDSAARKRGSDSDRVFDKGSPKFNLGTILYPT